MASSRPPTDADTSARRTTQTAQPPMQRTHQSCSRPMAGGSRQAIQFTSDEDCMSLHGLTEESNQCVRGDKATRLGNGSAFMDTEENWELEITAGQPGYVPAVKPRFCSTIGMSRRERKQMYTELLKQHTLNTIIKKLQATQDADCSEQVPNTSPHLSGSSGVSCKNGDAYCHAIAGTSEEVKPQSSKDRSSKQEASSAVAHSTAVALSMRRPRIAQMAPDYLSVVEADDAIWHTSASGRVRRMLPLQDAQATVPSSARAASFCRHPRTGV